MDLITNHYKNIARAMTSEDFKKNFTTQYIE